MFNSAERLSADEALSHVYFADCHHLTDNDSAFTTRRPSGTSVVRDEYGPVWLLGGLLRVDLIKWVSNVRSPIRTSIRPQKVTSI